MAGGPAGRAAAQGSGTSAPGLDRSGAPLELRRVTVEKAFVSVANEIKRLIFSGALRPGDRLPSEAELTERLGVSRQSVREALRVLEVSGLVRVQHGGAGGRIIVDTLSDSIGNTLFNALALSRVTTDELTGARRDLETIIVRHAVARADDTDLLYLRKNVQAAKAKLEAGEAATRENLEFHKLIAAAAKNQVHAILLDALMFLMGGSMSRLGMVRGPDKSRHFTAAHEAILAALVARDADLAARRMEEHLLEVTARLQEPAPEEAG